MANRKSNIRAAIAAGGGVTIASAIVEAILALFGMVRFGGVQFIDTDDYVQVPAWGIWVYVCLPVALGLLLFFWTWEDKLDDEERERRRAR